MSVRPLSRVELMLWVRGVTSLFQYSTPSTPYQKLLGPPVVVVVVHGVSLKLNSCYILCRFSWVIYFNSVVCELFNSNPIHRVM